MTGPQQPIIRAQQEQWEATLRQLDRVRAEERFRQFVPPMVRARLYKIDDRLF